MPESLLDTFPIDLNNFKKLTLDPTNPTLTPQQKADLQANIQLFRDAVVCFTATAAARGVSGHTGGAYDTAPEVCILLALFNHSETFYPVVFDEAGHRVATQYLLAALEGFFPPSHLLHYREAYAKLPGHPELGLTPGIKFSSGRLGHMWSLVNGIALAHPAQTFFMLGSDGSQQEGDNAEAARLAAAQRLNVKLVIDDNDVTIAGHPSEYLEGTFDVGRTLEGHGIRVVRAMGEDVDAVWRGVCGLIGEKGPAALVLKRTMASGIPDIEGSTHAHDVIPVASALKYLSSATPNSSQYPSHDTLSELYSSIHPSAPPPSSSISSPLGSTPTVGANRIVFGEAVCAVLDSLSSDEERKRRVLVIDSDLEGSTGLKSVHQKHPEVFVSSGIMERGNFSAAAGFGFKGLEKKGEGEGEVRTGVFSTFSAFLEMILSEVTMARLNGCNVLSHFSHSGVDEADNTCHFGLNNFFADSGLPAGDTTRLYFPADPLQMTAIVNRVFFERGLRFVFSTRSKVPWILKEEYAGKGKGEDGRGRFFDPEEGYVFVPGRDEVLCVAGGGEGDGYVVAYGEMLYRAWDAVLRCRKEGLMVGLVNKPTLNVVDEEMIKKIGQSPFVLVVESLNQKTGLGSKFGTWLLERGLTPKYGYMGSTKEGCGGLWEQIPHQGLDSESITERIKKLVQWR